MEHVQGQGQGSAQGEGHWREWGKGHMSKFQKDSEHGRLSYTCLPRFKIGYYTHKPTHNSKNRRKD